MSKSQVISFTEQFKTLKFVGDRTPESTGDQLEGAFAELAPYRDGAIFIGHYAGCSEWERHARGDEFVYALSGETTLVLLVGQEEIKNQLREGEFLVVPKNTWHRFETAKGVKIVTITPQPTDHSLNFPGA